MHQMVVGSNRDWRFILNMDQMSVYFAMSSKQMLELIGKKMVRICPTADDTKQATIAVTIAADGTLLPAMVIFKGMANGKIARTELGSYPTTNHYRCQESAWMDKTVMPHLGQLPLPHDGICHPADPGVRGEVQHIPGACTSLCQLINVGFNKPFKDRIRQAWQSWIMAEAVIHGTTRS
jgi:hypothetical protein